jgi:glycopeptide antibiotics resistance protein
MPEGHFELQTMKYILRNLPYLFWLYFFGIILLITLPVNKSGSLNNITVVHMRGDYFFHILTFFPWAFFGLMMKKNLWLWLLPGLLFAFGTELLQLALPWRRFNINDLIANGAGIFLGTLIFALANYFVKTITYTRK